MFIKTKITLITLRWTQTKAFAQSYTDFLNYQEIGGDCYLKKDYACAEKITV